MGGGGREEEFAAGCVVEQIETDTHPQQESLTPSRKHTHTQACKMQTHTQTNMHARTPQKHTHICARTHTHTHTHTHGVGWLRPQQMLSMNILAKLPGRVSICMDQM